MIDLIRSAPLVTNFVPRHVAVEVSEYYRDTHEGMGPLLGQRVALISIVGPNDSEPNLDGYWCDVLRLRFDDIDPSGCGEEFLKSYTLMNESHAKQILDFIDDNLTCDQIWVHCMAGISRSAAVAKFISEFYAAIGFPKKYALHNKHVLRTLVEAYNRRHYGIIGYK